MKTQALSKHEKYQSNNPISRYLIHHFFQNIADLYGKITVKSILDVGCGEGLVLKSLAKNVSTLECHAIDISEAEVIDAKRNIPFCDVVMGSADQLPFEDNAKELVICSEVLEHLENPDAALKEICRVTSKYAILTVPNEPLWRILNMVRGKYWSDWGNTPDHRNHWTPGGFRKFASAQFVILEERHPVPWNFLLCEKKAAAI